jgi:putative selenium metabolism hydrolase
MTVEYARVLGRAEGYKPAISRFLRDLIALPSESCQEREVIRRIRQEMESVGFERVEIDAMGNVLGSIGNGRHLIAMDAHIDNVGVGNPENWRFDPYTGYEDDEVIGGRGASDQKGGMASLVYAGRIIKDLDLGGDYTLLVTAPCRRRTATASAGSTSSSSAACGPHSWSPPSPPPAASTAGSGAGWRSRWRCGG